MVCENCYKSRGLDLDPSLLRETGGLELLAKDNSLSRSYTPTKQTDIGAYATNFQGPGYDLPKSPNAYK